MYTDASLTTEATPGASISKDTTLYAKWKVHEHTYSESWTYDKNDHWHKATCSHSSEIKDKAEHVYGTENEARYTCTVCGYVNQTKKENITAIDNAKKYIKYIGDVEYSSSCYYRILNARNAYDALTDEQKKEITEEELKTLTDAEAKYAQLEKEYNKAQAAAAVEKINAIGEVEYTEACKAKIDAASKAYSALTTAQRQLVSTEDLQTLLRAESAYRQLEKDHQAANKVVEKINAIGEVTYTKESKDKIDDARKAYDALTTDQKALVLEEDVKTLTSAESRYAKLKADDEAAKAAVEKIKAIGEVEYTEASKAKIDTAREAYDALTKEQKALITEEDVKVLADAESKYAKLKADDEAAKAAVEKIKAIGEVEYTEESKDKIDAAREAYDALTDDQKELVAEEDLEVLTDAESKYEVLKTDNEAAKAVVEKIDAIGKVEYTKASKDQIDEAREAYDALTDDQKAIITEAQYKALTDAEKAYEKLEADHKAAKVVLDKINAIGKVEYTKESKEKIDAVRKAYDALTKEQKAIITEAQYKTLIDAENTYAKLKTNDEAQTVIKQIEAIGKVANTTESKAKIDEARKAYDALSKEAKAVITEAQYKVLTDAESRYAELTEAADNKANTLTMNSKFSIKTGKSIKISWGKVKAADGYDVYVTYCGKNKVTFIKSTKSTSVTISKLMKKAVDQKKNVKCYVVAYKKVNGKKQQIGKTKVFHATGKKNKSVTEPKNIKLKKSSYVLTTGKEATIKAKIVKKNKKLPMIDHEEKFRYATSDSKVATVSKDGKITAKKKGTCYVYVYAVNGCSKKVKVTVK